MTSAPISITKSVNYQIKPTSVKANRKTVVIPASNGTAFAAEGTSVFYIPSLRNHVMDGQSGFLRFQSTITTAGYLDNSAQSMIERIMTYGPGGQLISDIQNYSVLAAAMLDLQLSQSEKLGLSPQLGTEDVYLTPTAAAAAFATASQPTAAEVSAIIPNANRKGMALANGTSYSFAIPLIHPLFTMSEKMFPSFACSDDIRIEITWSSNLKALVTSTVFTVNNPEIVVDFIEFDSAVLSLIQQTYAGRDLVIPAQDYRYYSSSISSGSSGNLSGIIPAKQVSARALFICPRPAQTQIVGSYAVSSRVCPWYTAQDNFRLNIGGVSVPNHPITTRITGDLSHHFAETQRALHAINVLEMNGNINRTYYNANCAQAGHSSATSAFVNGYVLGINLDTLRGQSDVSNSGMNLSNITTYYEAYIGTGALSTAGAAESVSLDIYVLHDIVWVVDASGSISLRS